MDDQVAANGKKTGRSVYLSPVKRLHSLLYLRMVADMLLIAFLTVCISCVFIRKIINIVMGLYRNYN